MKVRIFNKGNGWYISASNYKDNTDKAYLSLYFTEHSEPKYEQTEKGYSVIDIDILEAKFTSYKGKLGLTIFKYVQMSNLDVNDNYSNFGGEKSSLGTEIGIEQQDLPFY